MTAELDRLRPQTTVHKSAPRSDLQGMRAVAVLAVFADHLFGWPSGGFVGVDVFFVLSGFFITGLLIREKTTRRKLSFSNFYIRRVKRILPSALLVLTVTVIGAYVLFPAVRAKQTLLDALYSALFAANFRFEALGADYFQQDQPPSPLQHYWSLSIEEQFYFVWPALLVLIYAMTRGLRRRGKSWTRQAGMFAAMSVVVGASFTWAMLQSAENPNSAYFSTFTRVWELGVGALVAIAGPWIARIPSSIRPVLAYLGLAGVAASLFLINATVQFPAPWAALPVLSTALIVASFHGSQVRWMFPLTNRVARFFGDTSYTLYLWHWPVIILLMAAVPEGPLFYTLAIVLAMGLTVITYYFYEDPIRKSNWLMEPSSKKRLPLLPRSGWATVGISLALAAILSIAWIQYNDKLLGAKEEVQAASLVDKIGPLAPPPLTPPTPADPSAPGSNTFAPLLTPLPNADPCFGAPAIKNNQCALRNPDVPLRPSLDTFTEDVGTPSCWTEQDQPLKSCSYGYVGDDAVQIALVGDSHAQRILVALVPYLNSLKWRLTTYVGWGCVLKDPPSDACAAAMGETRQQLLDRKYAAVITTASREFGGNVQEFVRAWEPLAAAGSRIIVVADNPEVSEQSIDCLTKPSFGDDQTAECGTSRREALAKPDLPVRAAQLVPNARVVDLTQYYCTADRCPSIIGDVIVYRDTGSHVTATFFSTLAPALVDGLRLAIT